MYGFKGEFICEMNYYPKFFVLFILAIAATESAIGLSILTIFYRLKNSIELDRAEL